MGSHPTKVKDIQFIILLEQYRLSFQVKNLKLNYAGTVTEPYSEC